MSEREIAIRFRNDGTTRFVITIEPWGDSHVVAPGADTFIVARGPRSGDLELVRGVGELTIFGWAGSLVDVVATLEAPAQVTAEMTASGARSSPPVE